MRRVLLDELVTGEHVNKTSTRAQVGGHLQSLDIVSGRRAVALHRGTAVFGLGGKLTHVVLPGLSRFPRGVSVDLTNL